MKRISGKWIPWIIGLLCAVILMTGTVCAAAEEVTDSGSCGPDAEYTLTGDGTLRISGTGLIDDSSFEYRDDILHVIIGEGITGNMYGVFAHCENLLDVSLPSTFTEFGTWVFYDCISLTTVVVPEGTESIGFEAFGYCTGLQSVTLPASLQRISQGGFDYGCRSLTDVYYGGTMAQWETVEIGDGNSNLMTAVIHCSDGNLENQISMELADGVLTISGSGYMGDIPSEKYRSASEVVIGAGVNGGITCETFENCNSHIVSYTVDSGNSVYRSVNGALFLKNPATLILYPGDARSSAFTVPDGVKFIGKYAFETNGYLNSIMLPEGLEEIGNAAFFNCTALKSITIPASVIFIDPLSNLERCTSLIRIDVAEGNTEYASEDGILYSKDMTCLLRYPGGRTDTSYTVRTGVKELADHVFLGNSFLTSVTLPEGVESMETSVFHDCSALTEIYLPVSLTEISYDCFTKCPNLQNVYYAGTTEQWSEVEVAPDNLDLQACPIHCSDGDVMPDDMTGTCGEGDEESVTYVLTPSGDLTITGSGKIRGYAFHGFYRAIRVFIGNGITKIGNDAFMECTGLKEITIPASLTQFGRDAFHGCNALETVHYGGTIEQWTALAASYEGIENPFIFLKADCADGEYDPGAIVIDSGECGAQVTFTLTADGCLHVSGTGKMNDYDWNGGPWAERSKIRSVIIEEGVTSIGDLAFYNCDNLTEISMPDSLTRIGDFGIYVCDLESVTIPKNVTYIGTWAFSASDRLTEIRVAEENTSFSTYDGALYNKNRTTLLICPAGKTSYTVPDGVTNIDQAFQACHSMIQVVLPEGLTSIGGYTFSNLSRLTSLTIPRSMRQIKRDAVRNCESLTDIYYNGTIAEWGKIGIHESNEPLFANQCIIHCSDGDTKAKPTDSGLEMNIYSDFAESGYYIAQGLPLNGSGLFSADQIFNLSVTFDGLVQPSGNPVWTFNQTSGTASAEMVDGWSKTGKNIRLTKLPAQAETAVWHVTCKWGGKTTETDLAMTFKEAPSLPNGVEYTGEGPWTVKKGEHLLMNELFRFTDGWSLDGVPVQANVYYACREFYDAVDYDYRESLYKAMTPGAYSVGIAVRCANLLWVKDTTVYFTDSNGTIPPDGYISPAERFLELPDNLTAVPDEAFRGTAAQAVILPENCVSVGAYAFADSPDLMEVRLPETLAVSAIDEHAFDGCTGLAVIVARTQEQIDWALGKYIVVNAAE